MLTLHDRINGTALDNRTRTPRLKATIAAAIATIVAAGTAVPAMAQDNASYQDDREQTERDQDMEWEAGEGYHEEEWYDPSDWFDGNDGVDYEYNYSWYESEYTDDRDLFTDSVWYDGYWDGYYDGYYDDVYGYDMDVDFTSTYGDAYTDGYADGFYDSEADYTYDPYYYVSTWAYDYAERSDRERAGDDNRSRGDRAMPSERKAKASGDDEYAKTGKKAMESEREIKRVRGTVKKIEYLRGTGSESGTPLIVRVTFEDKDDPKVFNLGPKMSRSSVPFSSGDTVTFKATPEKMNDRTVLTTHKLNIDGKTARLATEPGMASQDNVRPGISGVLRSVSEVEIDNERYTLMRIRVRDGGSELIAFRSDALKRRGGFNAEPGDRIIIRGSKADVEGRTVIRPEQISVNGKQLSMR